MNLLQCIGVGVVTSTKETNTDEIMFYSPSLFPTAEGRATTSAKEVESKSKGVDGEEIVSRNLHSNALPATWLNMGDNNRITSPDVREGSKVAIYQVSGQNNYYWSSFGVNATTYRLETVIYGWSANPQVSENTEFDVDDFYIMKVSTHEGLISLRTSQRNGEATVFDIQVNAMDGNIAIAGDLKSYLVLDDVQRSMTYTNADGTVFTIDKETATFYSKDSLNLFTDKSINIKTKEINIQATLLNSDIGTTNWKGTFNHTGNYNQVGDEVRTGSSSTTGLVSSATDCLSAGVSGKGHVHDGVDTGPYSTRPPVS